MRVDRGRLYVAAPREGLAALSPDGNVLWRQGLADAGDLTPPQTVGPYLIFSGSRAGLFIVAREQKKMYEDLSRAISAGDGVRVILDRRSGERRQQAEKVASERRRGQRRSHPEVDTAVRSHGYAYLAQG